MADGGDVLRLAGTVRLLEGLILVISSSFSPPCLDSLASSSSPPAFCVLVEVA